MCRSEEPTLVGGGACCKRADEFPSIEVKTVARILSGAFFFLPDCQCVIVNNDFDSLGHYISVVNYS